MGTWEFPGHNPMAQGNSLGIIQAPGTLVSARIAKVFFSKSYRSLRRIERNFFELKRLIFRMRLTYPRNTFLLRGSFRHNRCRQSSGSHNFLILCEDIYGLGHYHKYLRKSEGAPASLLPLRKNSRGHVPSVPSLDTYAHRVKYWAPSNSCHVFFFNPTAGSVFVS